MSFKRALSAVLALAVCFLIFHITSWKAEQEKWAPKMFGSQRMYAKETQNTGWGEDESKEIEQQISARQNLVYELEQVNKGLKQTQEQLLSDARGGQSRGGLSYANTRDEGGKSPMKISSPVSPLPQQSPQSLAFISQGTPVTAPAHPLSNGQGAIAKVAFFHPNTNRYLSVIRSPGDTNHGWLQCNADSQTPLDQRTFMIVPQEDGWVAIKSVSTQGFIEMVPPSQPLAWVLRASSLTIDQRHQFRMVSVDNGLLRLQNRGTGSFMNVITDTPYNEVRGHGNKPRKRAGAGEEETTVFATHEVTPDMEKKYATNSLARAAGVRQKENDDIAMIAALPQSDEKRVVSYGLYGTKNKYIKGAIRNAELVKVYFPGWVARFYCASDVPKKSIARLEELGAEIIMINTMKGGIAGMFWRFLVADDDTVDRWIVRDSDSRLNPRERFAVEEWIVSGKAVHTIRDHPNHERPLNGGLWGGTKGAIRGMTNMVSQFKNRQSYGGDLQFLGEKIWPLVKNDQIAHDSYSCKKFPNSHPFPTKRPDDFQHVGQVFDEHDNPRMGDINCCLRGNPTPPACRKQKDWKFG